MELDALLKLLPTSSDPSRSEHLTIDGLLLRAPEGLVRILICGICIEFDRTDVVRVDLRIGLETDQSQYAIPVMVCVRRGAPLHDLYPSYPYDGLIATSQRPFAISSRYSIADIDNPKYRALEAAYLAAHGLLKGQP